MLWHYARTRPLLASCFVTLTIGVSQAGVVPGSIQFVSNQPLSVLPVGPAAVTATCSVGETRPSQGNFGAGAVTLAGVIWYTLLDPADCAACTGGALLLTTANMLGAYFAPGGCTFTVEVSIIGATPGPACMEPDPSVVLCGPQTIDYAVQPFQPFTASFPLPDRCCINGPAFLSVKLVDRGTCDPSGFAVGFQPPCVSCRSFIAFPSTPPFPPTEMCAQGQPGDLNQWVDADCCEPVPAVPDTWGRVKSLYR